MGGSSWGNEREVAEWDRSRYLRCWSLNKAITAVFLPLATNSSFPFFSVCEEADPCVCHGWFPCLLASGWDFQWKGTNRDMRPALISQAPSLCHRLHPSSKVPSSCLEALSMPSNPLWVPSSVWRRKTFLISLTQGTAWCLVSFWEFYPWLCKLPILGVPSFSS